MTNTNPEKRRVYWKRYYAKNRPRLIKQIKEKRDQDREGFRRKQREYRARNREKFLQREREYYLKKREIILQRKREAQRLRSKVRYWKDRDEVRYQQALADLNDYLEKKKKENAPG